jgi:hypothetical protein
MTEEVKDAPKVEESKKETKATVEAKPEVKEESKTSAKDTKVGDILESNKSEEKKEPKMVPEAVLLEYKKDNKELKKDIKALRELIENGASKNEVSQELKDIAEEHNVDPEFLDKLAKSIKQQAKAELEAEVKPIKEKELAQQREMLFIENYNKTLEVMPEYKGLAQMEVIKSLALNPNNANKTFAQLLELAYGHLIKGKKTIETTTLRGGTNKGVIDFDRARKDKKYFMEIMADPELKVEYNKDLHKRIKL